jgi:hypothetical protein
MRQERLREREREKEKEREAVSNSQETEAEPECVMCGKRVPVPTAKWTPPFIDPPREAPARAGLILLFRASSMFSEVDRFIPLAPLLCMRTSPSPRISPCVRL